MTEAQREISADGLEVLGGKWKLELIWRLSGGSVRWSTLIHSMPDAAPNVLTRQLRSLEENGLVLRFITSVHPPQIVEYILTEKGNRLVPTVRAIERWARLYGEKDTAVRFEVCQRVLSSRWMLQILSVVRVPVRFGGIQASLTGISRGVLAAQLQQLRDMGLVYQMRYDVFPPRVEYVLTDKGRGLLDILMPQPGYPEEKQA